MWAISRNNRRINSGCLEFTGYNCYIKLKMREIDNNNLQYQNKCKAGMPKY